MYFTSNMAQLSHLSGPRWLSGSQLKSLCTTDINKYQNRFGLDTIRVDDASYSSSLKWTSSSTCFPGHCTICMPYPISPQMFSG